MKFLLVDGKMLEWKDIVLTEELIDAQHLITQKIWFGYGGIPLFEENVKQVTDQCEQLSIAIPNELNDKRELARITKRMLNKNKFYRSGLISIKILTFNSSVHTIISSRPFQEFIFPYSESGLLVKFSGIKKYAGNKLNRFLFFNQRLWQASIAELSDKQFQQVVILNDQGFVCESAFSNIFIVAGDELITPSLQSGCHENTLRSVVLQASEKTGLRISERNFISKEMLLTADEVFIASEETGLKWIMGIETIRYIHYYSKEINEEVNKLLKNKAILMHPVI